MDSALETCWGAVVCLLGALSTLQW